MNNFGSLNPTPEQIWLKAVYVDAENEMRGFRKDRFGNWIFKSAYGNRNSDYGWEMDHSFPKSLGGLSTYANLEPVNWKANIKKSDSLPPSFLHSLINLGKPTQF